MLQVIVVCYVMPIHFLRVHDLRVVRLVQWVQKAYHDLRAVHHVLLEPTLLVRDCLVNLVSHEHIPLQVEQLVVKVVMQEK